METNQQRAAFLAAVERVRSEAGNAPPWEGQGFLPFMNGFLELHLEAFRDFDISDKDKLDLLINEARSAYLGRLMPDVMKRIVPKLTEDPRLEAFREFRYRQH